MKKLLAIGFVLCLMSMIPAADAFAYGISSARRDARFLTDRMAYEMDLTESQYDDIYEVNFDFIYRARDIMSSFACGEGWAINQYYDLLNVRNDDLRWILSDEQYNIFMGIDYFFRPIYTSGRNWQFRIYSYYPDRSAFYFRGGYCPRNYMYDGRHYRSYFDNVSYYRIQVRSFDDRRRCDYFGSQVPGRNRFDNRNEGYRGMGGNRDNMRYDNNMRNDNNRGGGFYRGNNGNNNYNGNRGNGFDRNNMNRIDNRNDSRNDNRENRGFNMDSNNGNRFGGSRGNDGINNNGRNSFNNNNNGNSMRDVNGSNGRGNRSFDFGGSNSRGGNNDAGRINTRSNNDRGSFSAPSRESRGDDRNSGGSRGMSETRSANPSNNGGGRR